MTAPLFLFVTCQVGAERAVKGEMARSYPDFRFAYSRPGFLTFKLPEDHRLAEDFALRSVFARAYGFSLGKAAGDSSQATAESFWSVIGERRFDRLHVWQRDTAPPGSKRFEPSLHTAAIAEAAEAIRRAAPHRVAPASAPPPEQAPPVQANAGENPGRGSRLPEINAPAEAGDFVVDVVMIEPGEWWIGYHRARAGPSCRPGGMWDLQLPPHAVSRAYLKMAQALLWSQFPMRPGQRVAEIGAAPGGSSQALLDRGLVVIGIDPAEIDPRVLEHPNFTHVQKRGADVRRREFRKVRWLAADMNVAPRYTLDTVEAIVTHREVNIRGLLLTLKLLEWELADEVPAYLERIRSWGYSRVRARQLQHNRQEICVAAVRVAKR